MATDQTHPPRSRFSKPRPLLLLGLSATLAIALGFALVSPARAQRLIVGAGYHYIFAVFALWVWFAWRVIAERGGLGAGWGPKPALTLLGLVAATAFAVWTDGFAHKVLFDEYVLQGTAWHMHLAKEVGAPLRAYDIAGTWTPIDTFLDKRPYFFPFLVSLLHDLTGFRLENGFALNVGMAFATLAATFWLARAVTARAAPAWLAVAALATLPLFGQNATGASMELLNLAMIAAVTVAATLYLRAPGDTRLGWLTLGVVLLAQTRYESVLFVFPAAAVVVIGWLRAGRILLPWPALIGPLLLVPYVWHDRFVRTQPVLWQLREGEEARFAWHYLAGNLEGARKFFFNVAANQTNSLWLTLAGLAGLIWAAWRGWNAWRTRAASGWRLSPEAITMILFGATIAANLALLMFYYWSRLDEPIAARFALPACLVLTLAAAWGAGSLDLRGWPATRIGTAGLVVWVLVFAAPAYAHRLYTVENLVMQELQWELAQVASRPGPALVITSKATLPYLMRRIPAVNSGLVQPRVSQIAWHLRRETFREIVVVQVLRPMSAKGDVMIDPEDELPKGFRLEALAEKRFGARWIRISRVLAIETAGEVATANHQ